MTDITDFKRYKIIYLAVILLCVFFFAWRSSPIYYRASIDVSVEPPEEARKTDFSWITVNEWFITQVHLIKSNIILGQVKPKSGREKLEKIVSAERTGAANVIRISAYSPENPEELKSLVNEIALIYLNQLKQPEKPVEKPVGQERKKNPSVKTRESLLEERIKLRDEIWKISKRLRNYYVDLNSLGGKPGELGELKRKIKEIDDDITPLESELEVLRLTYTDNWPENVKLIKQIKVLEEEKKKLTVNLPALEELEGKKSGIASKIAAEKTQLRDLEDSFRAINDRLEQMEDEYEQQQEAAVVSPVTPGTEKAAGPRIISAPSESAQKIYPLLWLRLSVAAALGIICWFLLGLVLKNIYLFWVLKDRIFRRR